MVRVKVGLSIFEANLTYKTKTICGSVRDVNLITKSIHHAA